MPYDEGLLTGSLERQYPDENVDSYPSAQTIVVLGETIHMPSLLHHASGIINPSDRLLMAPRLYHAGKAPIVVLSGGNNPLLSEKVPRNPRPKSCAGCSWNGACQTRRLR